MVAAGLLLGGLLTQVTERLDLAMPGLLARRPPETNVEEALGRASQGDAEPEASLRTDSAQATGPAHKLGNGAGADGTPGIREEGPAELRARRLGPIDINSASVDELQKLDGIGPALAGRIVELRNRKGRFQRMEDLLEVRGIGPATLARIKASAGLSRPGGPQNTLRTSTSTQADSSAFQR